MVFHVGQKVVCVSDRFAENSHWRKVVRTFPKLHSIYTIREICDGYGSQQGLVGFCFYEIVNPTALFGRDYEEEPAYNSENFRPIRKTSIEAFEKLLSPVDRNERRAKTVVPV